MSVIVIDENGTNEYADIGEVSDGYHTFNELYEFRMLYNAIMFDILSNISNARIHKSIRHADGKKCFGGGWFVVMAYLPQPDGKIVQVSNHYEMEDWDLFRCEVRERADAWDGHSSEDVAARLRGYIEVLVQS